MNIRGMSSMKIAMLAGALAMVATVLPNVTSPAYAQLRRGAVSANAAVAADVFKVTYFDTNIMKGDAVAQSLVPSGSYSAGLVRVVNPTSTPVLCEMVYVFDAQEEEEECCGCPVTTDGLRTQSVDYDLTDNPATGEGFHSGVIKIIASLPNAGTGCNPALPPSLSPTLRAWISHSGGGFLGTGYSVTEFSDAPLDATEQANLVSLCNFIHLNGSGHGICTCGSGDTTPPHPVAGR